MRARLDAATERRIAVAVDAPDGRSVLEYTSPDPVWQAAPATLDFAAVALAQHAAAAGCDLEIEGPVTRDQLDRLDEYLMIWSVWRPDLFARIRIGAADEVVSRAGLERRGAVMGFSGGVDAGFALAAHQSQALGRFSRPIDLGVLVVGWDLRHGDSDAIRRAAESARQTLRTYGAEQALISTNWQQEFSPAWFMSYTAGLMAVLHTFSATHSGAVHASDRGYREELLALPHGSHIAINHLLGHPGFPVWNTGGTHKRIERVAFLADHPVLLKGLRVCFKPEAGGGNCGHCEKCVRTQLEMRAVGLPTDAPFPSPLRLDDIRSMEVRRWTAMTFYEAIIARLSPEDPAYETLQRWMRKQRLSRNPEVRRLRARVRRLEEELVATQAVAEAAGDRLASLHASTSWRVSQPLRAVGDRVRRLRKEASG